MPDYSERFTGATRVPMDRMEEALDAMLDDSIPKVVDLTWLAHDLAKQGGAERLVRATRRSLVAHSCLQDLQQANDMLNTLETIHGKEGGFNDGMMNAIEAALMSTAIQLYIRATETRSSRRPAGEPPERGPLDIAQHLPDDLKADHAALYKIRNVALSHVHLNRRVESREWHSSNLLGVQRPEGTQIAFHGRRLKIEERARDRLRRLLPPAIAIADRLFAERAADYCAALVHEAGKNPELIAMMNARSADILDVFGSYPEAKAELARLIPPPVQPG